MAELPIMISLTGRRIVIVGGGQVAFRRAQAMLDAGGDVCIVAPDILPELAGLPLTRFQRPYRGGDQGDLENAFLVVIATNDPEVNEAVARDARRLDILINRTDHPELGDLIIPAHARRGPLTLAVHTGGISARAAANIRDQLLDALDPDLIRLLEVVAPYRDRIKQAITDSARRRRALRALTDDEALHTLKSRGEAALQARCEALLPETTT